MPRTVAIDLHCHILPGIDDGPSDVDDAIAMARQAEADGITAVCATPHIRHDHDVRIPELPVRLQALHAGLRAVGCATEILPGGEVATTALRRLDKHELAAVALGGRGRWILLEPSPGPIDEGLVAAVELLDAHGFRALIAHPERHLAPDVIDQLKCLIDKGALVQATAAVFTDDRTRAGMLSLARAGVIHVLGSDAHSARAGRPVRLAAALEVLAEVEPVSRHLDWVARVAPEAIVSGDELTPPF